MVRQKLCVEKVLAEITAFIDSSNERTRTSVRNRLRNELQNFIDPSLPDIYPVPKKPEQVRAALTACVTNIDDIVDVDYRQCFRCVLRRAIASSFFVEVATTTANEAKESLKQLTAETYAESLHIVLKDGFDDLELSGRAALSFFHYCCGEAQRGSDVLGPCLRQLNERDDWLDVCAGAVAQDHHAAMLRDVDNDLHEYVAGSAAGGLFVSSAALAFYLSISASAFAGDEKESDWADEWMTKLRLLEIHLATVASRGKLFQHLNSSCSELRRLAEIKHRRLTARCTERSSTAQC